MGRNTNQTQLLLASFKVTDSLTSCSPGVCLQHVASNIVDHEIRHKEILQSSFDLLGELVKFNIEAFKTFDSILTTQEKVCRNVPVVRLWPTVNVFIA